MSILDRLTIYTDGSCSPNPGKGGWAFIALLPDCEVHFNGKDEKTTNNIMEMTAVIQALKEFSHTKNFLIYTDSMYVINCAQGKWQRKKNVELWKEYDTCSQGKDIIFSWVKGHSGNTYNELVDKLAKY
jgi:ribonuclease HI